MWRSIEVGKRQNLLEIGLLLCQAISKCANLKCDSIYPFNYKIHVGITHVILFHVTVLHHVIPKLKTFFVFSINTILKINYKSSLQLL